MLDTSAIDVLSQGGPCHKYFCRRKNTARPPTRIIDHAKYFLRKPLLFTNTTTLLLHHSSTKSRTRPGKTSVEGILRTPRPVSKPMGKKVSLSASCPTLALFRQQTDRNTKCECESVICYRCLVLQSATSRQANHSAYRARCGKPPPHLIRREVPFVADNQEST